MDYEIKKCSVLDAGADIIVNAANNALQVGGGVCGAIFNKAGYKVLQKECNSLAPIDTGEVAVTKGYNTGADYIIHAVGPNMWNNGADWKTKLKQVYWNSLVAADNKNGEVVAFPCISTGIYGCPLRESVEIVLEVVDSFNASKLKKVLLCCFTDDEYEVYLDVGKLRF